MQSKQQQRGLYTYWDAGTTPPVEFHTGYSQVDHRVIGRDPYDAHRTNFLVVRIRNHREKGVGSVLGSLDSSVLRFALDHQDLVIVIHHYLEAASVEASTFRAVREFRRRHRSVWRFVCANSRPRVDRGVWPRWYECVGTATWFQLPQRSGSVERVAQSSLEHHFLALVRRPTTERLHILRELVRLGSVEYSLHADGVLEGVAPRSLDTPDPRTSKYFWLPTPELYSRTFCDVVMETQGVSGTGWVPTEKTLKPLLAGVPFVLAAPRDAWSWLRSQGFQDYGPWWPNSYDSVEDLVLTLREIRSWSLERLEEIRAEMQPRLEHNRQLALEWGEGRPLWQTAVERASLGFDLPTQLGRLPTHPAS